MGADTLGVLRRQRAIQAGLYDLEQIFSIQLGDHLVDALFVDWQAHPHARMGYSYVPVGGKGLRMQLAQPVDQVLFFAGEATYSTRAVTVYSALKSGIRAVHEILSLNTNRST